MASATRSFEAAERERVSSVSRALSSFVVRQAEFYAGQMKELEALTQVCLLLLLLLLLLSLSLHIKAHLGLVSIQYLLLSQHLCTCPTA